MADLQEVTRAVSTDRPTPLIIHIIPREKVPGVGRGPPKDRALCGELWDLPGARGRFCERCVEIYRRDNPGAPLPTR